MKHDLLKVISIELGRFGINCASNSKNDIIEYIQKYKLREPFPKLKYLYPATSRLDLQTDSGPPIQYTEISEAISGNFGTLYNTLRTSNKDKPSHVFLKFAKHKQQNTLHIEALLQSITSTILSFYGFSWAVPRVLDIVRHPRHGIGFSIEKSPDAMLFKDYLEQNLEWGTTNESNDLLLLGVISTLATYLAILEEELILNHRDLTGSNVLMIIPSEPFQKTIHLLNHTWTVQVFHKTILVDFGFACLGSLPSRKTLISAGEYFPESDFCPKDGRDIFLFIASLWKNPLLRQSITLKTSLLIHKWLCTPPQNNWAQWIESAVNIDMRSMYLLTMSESFSNSNTNPLQILKDIASEFPHLVYFQKTLRSSTPIPRSLYS